MDTKDIKDITDKTCVCASLKAKRFMRVIRRPFLRVKSDCSLDLYTDESTGDPLMSSKKNLDSDIKLFDIACAFAAMCAFFSFVRAICRIFDR